VTDSLLCKTHTDSTGSLSDSPAPLDELIGISSYAEKMVDITIHTNFSTTNRLQVRIASGGIIVSGRSSAGIAIRDI
jgi:hypothetical protein